MWGSRRNLNWELESTSSSWNSEELVQDEHTDEEDPFFLYNRGEVGHCDYGFSKHIRYQLRNRPWRAQKDYSTIKFCAAQRQLVYNGNASTNYVLDHFEGYFTTETTLNAEIAFRCNTCSNLFNNAAEGLRHALLHKAHCLQTRARREPLRFVKLENIMALQYLSYKRLRAPQSPAAIFFCPACETYTIGISSPLAWHWQQCIATHPYLGPTRRPGIFFYKCHYECDLMLIPDTSYTKPRQFLLHPTGENTRKSSLENWAIFVYMAFAQRHYRHFSIFRTARFLSERHLAASTAVLANGELLSLIASLVKLAEPRLLLDNRSPDNFDSPCLTHLLSYVKE